MNDIDLPVEGDEIDVHSDFVHNPVGEWYFANVDMLAAAYWIFNGQVLEVAVEKPGTM